MLRINAGLSRLGQAHVGGLDARVALAKIIARQLTEPPKRAVAVFVMVRQRVVRLNLLHLWRMRLEFSHTSTSLQHFNVEST